MRTVAVMFQRSCGLCVSSLMATAKTTLPASPGPRTWMRSTCPDSMRSGSASKVTVAGSPTATRATLSADRGGVGQAARGGVDPGQGGRLVEAQQQLADGHRVELINVDRINDAADRQRQISAALRHYDRRGSDGVVDWRRRGADGGGGGRCGDRRGGRAQAAAGPGGRARGGGGGGRGAAQPREGPG